ncbi:hypothetical protein RPMA_21275 [Tardiphaga alba]|uniref:Outer membrane beta-barrel protein n=1 Tax=Tardiphaga alba TaxID=340268 RepID=A0ABX8ACU5_9BRAD|nr:outer membrane beta-barrel protein [Tardiphaga alba]QUS41092.1 hypothetical protein RPMA_21275 [Tardiphaga alba]
MLTMRRVARVAPWSLAALLIGASSAVHAQAIQNTMDPLGSPWNAQRIFEPSALPELEHRDTRDSNNEPVAPEDTPVKNRQQPGYEPVGIRHGSWMFNPSLMTGALYDSNVFASNTQKRSDIAAVIEPSLRAHTLWERHGIDLKLNSQSTIYNENSSLDQTNASLKGAGWFDVAHDMVVLGSFQIARLNEGVGSLSSPTNAVTPTPYNLFSGDLTVRKEWNRFTGSVGARVDSYEFGTARAQDGSIIDQSARDGQIYAVHGRIDYAFSPSLGWFAGAEGNQRDLRGIPGSSIDSTGYRVLSGFTVGLGRLVKGEFGGGYVEQRFDNPLIGTVSGPSYRAKLTWSPTRMLDIHVKAEQLVTQTSDTSSTGVLANAVQIGADYELLRNVVLSASAGYETDRFFGQDRRDTVTSTNASVKYLMNRFSSISAYHRYTSRDSNTPIFSYDKHQVGINVTAQF